MAYWLFKTEPETFSFQTLSQAPDASATWDGVRNYTARNFLRDTIKKGDQVFIYHSSTKAPAIAGIATVSVSSYTDDTAFQKGHSGYDAAAVKRGNNPWVAVTVTAHKKALEPIKLSVLRTIPKLSQMFLLRPGQRLSVQPVTDEEWAIIVGLTQWDAP